LALFGRRPPERVVGIVGAGVRKPAQKPTLFDQFKNENIAAAAIFHRAFQQTVGLETHPLL
jgi:hypothetical protein